MCGAVIDLLKNRFLYQWLLISKKIISENSWHQIKISLLLKKIFFDSRIRTLDLKKNIWVFDIRNLFFFRSLDIKKKSFYDIKNWIFNLISEKIN